MTPTQDAAGNHNGYSKILRDMTDRKRLEEELIAARDGLERRVQQATADLSRTVTALQEEVACRTAAEHDVRQRSDQLRALAGELTVAEQRERKRVAKILHDHLQQLIIAVKLRLSDLMPDREDETRAANMRRIGELLEECLQTCRTLTAELSPTFLPEEGLASGLNWLVQGMAEKHGLAVDLLTLNSIPPLPEDITLLLFESIRELLFNVVKHAGVKSAQVAANLRENELLLTISDEGQGFDPRQVSSRGPKTGFGLFSICERLELFGGRMEVHSAASRGSRIVLSVPLERVRSPAGLPR